MQLILESENSSIDLKDTMTTLNQELLDDKLKVNGVLPDPITNVPNGNKENIQVEDNIIANDEDNICENKQIPLDPPTIVNDENAAELRSNTDTFSEKKDVSEKNCEENSENSDENKESFTNESNGESQTHIVQQIEIKTGNEEENSVEYLKLDSNASDNIKISESESEIINNEIKLQEQVNTETDLDKLNNSEHATEIKSSEEVKSNDEFDSVSIPKSPRGEVNIDACEPMIIDSKKIDEVVVPTINETNSTSTNENTDDNDSSSKKSMDCSKIIEIHAISNQKNNEPMEFDEKENCMQSVDCENMKTSYTSDITENLKTAVRVDNDVVECDEKANSKQLSINDNLDINNSISKTEILETTGDIATCDNYEVIECPKTNSEESLNCDNLESENQSNKITNILGIVCQDNSEAMECNDIADCDELKIKKQTHPPNIIVSDKINTPESEIITKEFSDIDVTDTANKINEDLECVNVVEEVQSKKIADEPNEKSDTKDSGVIKHIDTQNSIDDSITQKNDEQMDSETREETITKCKELNVDEVKIIEHANKELAKPTEISPQNGKVSKSASPVCRLSNTLDILSDDDEEPSKTHESQSDKTIALNDKQCINIEDDDDIMLIDEDKDDKTENVQSQTEVNNKADTELQSENTVKFEESKYDSIGNELDKVTILEKRLTDIPEKPEINEKTNQNSILKTDNRKPLVAENFLKGYKKNLADMTRDELEEFCILKIVESIIDRSNLNEIKSKLKSMAQNIDEHKKKAMMLTKQNRDLQVVLKSVQEEQKKGGESPITPLKITRSVGMQVLMSDKNSRRKGISSGSALPNHTANTGNRPQRAVNQSPRQQPQANNNQSIPVPRLVPAANSTANKNSNNATQATPLKNAGKVINSLPNGLKSSPSISKTAEKRPHNRIQSVTVDLTDDEPPSKVATKSSPAPPVRLVPSQNLMAQRQPVTQTSVAVNSPRKVYIPISAPPGQNVRPGHIMLKGVPPPGPRQRPPIAPMVRIPQNPVRMARLQGTRHPAPLPDAMKQYQPPNWKALPPAPDLKLSKVENGIVISWKIDGYQDDSYEEIASYQLYAYQETNSPPSTTLWKKIGDVKALPLPMACTLTQFMAGYKYYFAVRAVDVRSRLGPFSLPGSILLLNKM